MAKNITTSPFAPKTRQDIKLINGVRCFSVNCGLYKHKEDLCLFVFDENTSVAGVFTKSQMASPPVLKCRENLKNGNASALIVNSGNSLAMTGEKGTKIVEEIVSSVATHLELNKDNIFICSTGVIGALLESSKITNALPSLCENLSSNNIEKCAKAIMTTDTFPKIISKSVSVNGKVFNITGISKGSGMIEPNMATMLSFIFTDIVISSDELQKMVNKFIDTSFNSITVDSDTSTSDSLLVFATNKINLTHGELNTFEGALQDVMQELAKLIIMDGEGIQKFITVNVSGAESDASAKVVAKSIANSPLVKTAICGADPNWGRIAMAIGKTQELINLNNLTINIGGHRICENGCVSPDFSEEVVYYYLRGAFIEIFVNVGNVGVGKSTVWTCDLTHGYIDINTDYRS